MHYLKNIWFVFGFVIIVPIFIIYFFLYTNTPLASETNRIIVNYIPVPSKEKLDQNHYEYSLCNYEFYCVNGTVLIAPRSYKHGTIVQLLNPDGNVMKCNNF